MVEKREHSIEHVDFRLFEIVSAVKRNNNCTGSYHQVKYEIKFLYGCYQEE